MTVLPVLPGRTRQAPTDLVRAGLAGLIGRPTRAVLSALGIGIGVAAMVAVLGISTASHARLAEELSKLGTNLLSVGPGKDIFGGDTTLPKDAVAMVRRIGPVQTASAVGELDKCPVYRNDQVDPRATGGISVNAAKLNLLDTLAGRPSGGQWLNAATAKYPAVVLGAKAAQQLGIDTPGVQIYLGHRWFTVVGILAPLTLAPNLDRAAFVGWDAAQSVLGFDGHPTTVYERSPDESVQDVREVLAASVNPANPDQVTVSRPSDALQAQLTAGATFVQLFLGLGAVALLVGGVGVANTMVISVLERRPEIGLRRALGARKGQIRAQFLTEAVLLSAAGGVFGVLLGLAISTAYALVSDWPPVVPWAAVGLGLGAAVLTGALAGWFPAARAAKLAPSTVLATG
ncbi:ABC transporter permease [Fodinicola acaciae]|uniref:ABC transporter permease n=1 Tax=Fodinicola acaciae TaxID=2681555 RepID=UPI0013D13344|nr:ABC transporter permease [Fodinicola acaciae]